MYKQENNIYSAESEINIYQELQEKIKILISTDQKGIQTPERGQLKSAGS